jgi:hypothetical protein
MERVGEGPTEAGVYYPWSGGMSSRLSQIKERLLEESTTQFTLSPDNFRYTSVDVYQGMESHLETVHQTKQELFNRNR